MAQLLSWCKQHVGLSVGLLVAWVAMLVGTLLLAHRFLVTIPPDYFTKRHAPLEQWRGSHPLWRWTLLLAKNLAGAALAIAGLIMIFTPGQGVLALLLGISLLDFPGKRRLERWIVGRPGVGALVNGIRRHAGQPPLSLPH